MLARRREGALIGPNAILQTVTVMEARMGAAETRAVLAEARIGALPSGRHMIPEIHALRLHRWLSLHDPLGSFLIAEEAGAATADYIIANRIPRAAAWLLHHLPAMLAAPLLMAAIRKHAWTFIGAGAFAAQGPWRFTIDRAGADDPVPPPDSLFHWYAAVFTRLYQRLVASDCRCLVQMTARPEAPLRHYRIERG
ncbi:bacteriochlorophyll 4-vinyl reductase [Cyanobium sp. LEGE 06113]|uniref:bacteriochlorophyll 4-vinyl reductase n=1 Tax=Cyanobium sp. LEGE 06113 TaxID=1297573 RepID=UPI00187E394C|nr:bacteriochlorophyll 4-vinyl reductase [Cyanobium sp. LEGE 06113]